MMQRIGLFVPFQQSFGILALFFPPFVIGEQLAVIGIQQDLSVLGKGDTQRLRKFAFRGRAAQMLLQLLHRLGDFAGVTPYAARHPVAATQFIEHCAADTLHRIGGKGRSL
jgi:hypothetical protein